MQGPDAMAMHALAAAQQHAGNEAHPPIHDIDFEKERKEKRSALQMLKELYVFEIGPSCHRQSLSMQLLQRGKTVCKASTSAS